MAAGEGMDDRLLDELVRLREAIQALPAGLPAAPPEIGAGRDADVVRALPELVTLLETSSSAIDALERRLDLALRQIRATLQELNSPPPDVASQLKASLQRLGDARRELQSLGRAFREVAASSRGMLEAHDAPGGARDPQLARALEELSHNVQRFNERVRGFMKRVDEELARSSQALTGAMSGLPKGRD
jgi:DNA repair exonuclease SbcCD ATPase subunit